MYRQIGGKNGIHHKLVNRLGTVDGIERFGGMMMKYKVGDEVLVKAVINDICVGEVHPYEVKAADNPRCGSLARAIYVREEDVIPVPTMTAEEAWDIAKNLFADYSNAELDEIFGKGWSFPKLMELTPHEAKARIEAWEAEKEIKVGDVVIRCGESCIVTNESRDDGFYDVLFKDGTTGAYKRSSLKKTGRHVDIEGILKQIGGDE